MDGNFAKALPILSKPARQQGTLGDYAQYYQGFAELRLGRPAEARRTFQALAVENPVGFLAEGAALREAEADEALGDQAAALEIYERLAKTKTTAPDEVLMRLGTRRRAPTGSTDRAIEAFIARRLRVSVQRPRADRQQRSSRRCRSPPIAPGTNRYKLELGRARAAVRRQALRAGARRVRRRCAPLAQGDDRELVELRLAECDYFLKRPRNARDGVRPYIDKASRQGEALFFYAVAVARSRRSRRVPARRSPPGRRVPDAELGRRSAEQPRHALHPRRTTTRSADETFRELYEKFPDRPLRGARRVEDRLAGVQERPVRRRPSASSSRRRRSFRAPTTGRRGCTGRAARTRR